MNLLILGGREFLGRSIVNALQIKGHQITLFNRGQTNAGLFSDLELIKGDRNHAIDLLRGRRWDAVIDTCGYFPDQVAENAKVLKQCVDHYVFISSCSVYDHTSKLRVADESAPLEDLNVDIRDTTWGTYGARKYLCETAIDRNFGSSAAHIRPGLIVGPFDTTYRFPYWADRIAEGGVVLAPGRYDAPTQFIDVRDLASWVVQVCENRITGYFNANGPAEPVSIGRFLDMVVSEINPKAKLEWISEKFLREHNVSCWSQLPLWVYEELEIFVQRDAKKAITHGLSFRPIKETIIDTFNWSRTLENPEFKKAALSRERESAILHAYLQ